MNRSFLAALILSLAAILPGSTAHAEELCIASWNVENLFDTKTIPKSRATKSTHPNRPRSGPRSGSTSSSRTSASIISKMNGGKGPDVLGLCEIENRKVVEMLVEKLAPLGRKYEIVHQDSPSDRGIDCAIILRCHRVHLVDRSSTSSTPKTPATSSKPSSAATDAICTCS